jgi:hypothetical protein
MTELTPPRADTDDEIIAAALLLGATFTREGKWFRAFHAVEGQSTGIYRYERDAAHKFLLQRGFHTNFYGQLVKA